MTAHANYTPGPATGARVQKDGDLWTLILTRDLHHPREAVWAALTDPAQLAEWAPFDASRNLGAPGPAQLTTAGTPKPQISATTVKRAEPPRLLEYDWGGAEIRWELEPHAGGTRLTLWHSINPGFVAWGAAGWHVCLDVLDHLLDGKPIGRMVGGDALKSPGWQRLTAEYGAQFGVESPRQ